MQGALEKFGRTVAIKTYIEAFQRSRAHPAPKLRVSGEPHQISLKSTSG
jgi:hypothetical protein